MGTKETLKKGYIAEHIENFNSVEGILNRKLHEVKRICLNRPSVIYFARKKNGLFNYAELFHSNYNHQVFGHQLWRK